MNADILRWRNTYGHSYADAYLEIRSTGAHRHEGEVLQIMRARSDPADPFHLPQALGYRIDTFSNGPTTTRP